VLAAGLVWHMRHPPEAAPDALLPPPRALQRHQE